MAQISSKIDNVNHCAWCEPFLVYPITHGVDHFWCTPRLIGWTMPDGMDHFWCAPPLVGYTTPHEFTSPEDPSGKPDFLLLQHLQ